MLMIKKLQENLIIDFYTYFLKASLNRNFLVEMNEREHILVRAPPITGAAGFGGRGRRVVGRDEPERVARLVRRDSGGRKAGQASAGRKRQTDRNVER
jgi:hypothetical protein